MAKTTGFVTSDYSDFTIKTVGSDYVVVGINKDDGHETYLCWCERMIFAQVISTALKAVFLLRSDHSRPTIFQLKFAVRLLRDALGGDTWWGGLFDAMNKRIRDKYEQPEPKSTALVQQQWIPTGTEGKASTASMNVGA